LPIQSNPIQAETQSHGLTAIIFVVLRALVEGAEAGRTKAELRRRAASASVRRRSRTGRDDDVEAAIASCCKIEAADIPTPAIGALADPRACGCMWEKTWSNQWTGKKGGRRVERLTGLDTLASCIQDDVFSESLGEA
jgi:hypothetical protein